MAQLEIDWVIGDKFRWRISGLQSQWRTANYSFCGLTDDEWVDPNGQTSAPPSIIDTQNAPSSGTSYNTPWYETYHGMSDGDTTFVYGFVKTPVSGSNKYYLVPGEAADDYLRLVTARLPSIDYDSTDKTSTTIKIYINSLRLIDEYEVELWNNTTTTLISTANAPAISGEQTTITFGQLSPNTTYKIQARAIRYDNYNLSKPYYSFSNWTSWATATTDPAITKLATPSSPTLYGSSETYRYQDGFRVQVSAVTGAQSYQFKVRRGYDSETTYHNTSLTNVTISGKIAAVAYYVSVKAISPNGSAYDSNWSSETLLLTRPVTPTINATTTINTVTAIISGMSSNYSSIEIYLRNSAGTLLQTKTLTGNGSTTFTGLSTGTTYKVDARSIYVYNGVTYYSTYSLQLTITTSSYAGDWEWEYTIASGYSLYQTIGSIGYLMRAAHWNDFTAKVNSYRLYKGLGTYTFNTATTLTTEIGIRNCINQAITALNATGFSQPLISTGNNVAASIFITLKNNVNTI